MSTGPTPWSEVRRTLEGPRVAADVGLKPARERGKYGCVRCDSSDALHVYRDGAKCFSCGWSGSVIDLYALARGVEPAEACRMLAERYGIRPDPMYRPERPERPERPVRPEPRDPDPDVLPHRAEVYGDLVARTTLGDMGRRYLDARGLSPDLADVHGIRSLETPEAWRSTWTDLERTHGTDAMIAAGLWRDGRPWCPWRGQVPALVLPYLDPTGQVVAVRWRRMTPGDRRYMAPLGAPAPIPWGAEAVDGPRPLELVLVEGELDALAARMAGYDSMALGGTTPSGAVIDWLVEHVADVDGLALWFDGDDAGRKAVRTVALALGHRYGVEWVRSRVCQWRSAGDPAETLGAT